MSFGSGIPLVMVGLDVTPGQFFLIPTVMDTRIGTTASDIAADLLDFYAYAPGCI